MGREVPQSRHCVTLNCVPQCGQSPCARNVSKALPHFPQRHSAPSGGAVLHEGHAKPSRRGSLAMRASARACFKPPQQFIKINAVMMPNQMDCAQIASPANPATPMKPMMLAASKLLARPKGNQSNERRICPPSSGYTGIMLKINRTRLMRQILFSN